MDNEVPALVEAIDSEPFTKGERRALRRLLKRAAVGAIVFLAAVIVLSSCAAAMGYCA